MRAVRVDYVVLYEGVCGPAVDGQVLITVWLKGSTVFGRPKVSDLSFINLLEGIVKGATALCQMNSILVL